MRARARETSESHGATFRHLYLWEKYHRCMNGFFPYVIYYFDTHHASPATNTSNPQKTHVTLRKCQNIDESTNNQHRHWESKHSHLILISYVVPTDKRWTKLISDTCPAKGTCDVLHWHHTLNRLLFWFFWFGTLIRILLRFYPNWIENEVSKIPYVHASYKHQIPPLILNPREPTLNRFLFWFFWFGALIKILLRFYPKWIKNEVAKIPYVHTSYKHQIPPKNVFSLVTLNRNPRKLIDWYAAAIDPRTKDQQPAPSYFMPSHFKNFYSKSIIGAAPTNNSLR